jgi:transaldolase/glucose-6-phosphate isomerase
MNPLFELEKAGQSVWLDFLSRELLDKGLLDKLIRDDGVSGLTSNPTIFEKAISKGADYDEDLRKRSHDEPADVFEDIAVADIRRAADRFRPIYDKTKGRDGFVSIEVSPGKAYDTQATIDEARRLWKKVGRPNVMVKIPGTKQGLPAIRACLGEGININITLLFSNERYAEVVEAYLSGLEDFVSKGGDPAKLASVASFFVSRVDTAVDDVLKRKIAAARQDSEKAALQGLLGKVAIANAKLAYQTFKMLFNGARFKKLQAKGAAPQRVLFASTSTKNPSYRDVMYAEELIGPETVDTMPLETIEAFRDHGRARLSLEEDVDAAKRTIDKLANYQIDLAETTRLLEEEGVKKFVDSYDQLLAGLASKRKVLA